MSATFTYKRARSGSLMAGLGLALAIETLALHLLLRERHPVVAWALTALSVLGLVWLAVDYRSFGRNAIAIHGGTLELDVGLRSRATIDLDAVVETLRPSWRDLPAPASIAARDYRNLMKPAIPNVLLVLAAPTTLVVAGSVRVPVRRIGLHLDEPDAFVAAMKAPHSGATFMEGRNGRGSHVD